jgi:hypothetical protein
MIHQTVLTQIIALAVLWVKELCAPSDASWMVLTNLPGPCQVTCLLPGSVGNCISRKYKIDLVPTVLFVKEGEVISKTVGEVGLEGHIKHMRKLLAEQTSL